MLSHRWQYKSHQFLKNALLFFTNFFPLVIFSFNFLTIPLTFQKFILFFVLLCSSVLLPKPKICKRITMGSNPNLSTATTVLDFFAD